MCCTLFTLSACVPKGPHKPVAAEAPSPTIQGDAISGVSYSQIQPIVGARCARCHSVGAMNWMDENTLSNVAKRGVLRQRLASKSMPQAGSPEASSITEAERKQILSWADGLSNKGKPQAMTMQGGGNTEMDPANINNINLAFVSKCMSCHGPQGTNTSQEFPNLAGHGKNYIVARLNEFLDPSEQSTMGLKIKELAKEFGFKADDQKAKDLITYAAAFFSTYNLDLNAEDLSAAREKLSASDKVIYEKGKKVFAENACASCHLQADLRPIPDAAMIFAQKKDYVAKRLTQFKSGSGGSMMPAIAEALSEEDIQGLALYLSHTLPQEAAQDSK